MKERPIIFSGESVRAILEGRKTQTRRLVKPRDQWRQRLEGEANWVPALLDDGEWGWTSDGEAMGIIGKCPYGKPDDLLWVRETWGTPAADHPKCVGGRRPQPGDRLVYRANLADDYQWGPGLPSQGSFVWRAPLFMPRWASRLTLKVSWVRVERLQWIEEEDALAEGVGSADEDVFVSARDEFAGAWDRINGKRAPWASNPWVWEIGFRRAE